MQKSIYKTNLVKFTPKDEKGKIRYPSKEEISSQLNLLIEEIKTKQPKVILAMGNMVSDYLQSVKELIPTNIEKVEHPSYISVYRRKQIDEYLEKINGIICSHMKVKNKQKLIFFSKNDIFL